MVAAGVLFLASLTGIAVYNPGVSTQTAVPTETQHIKVVKPGSSKPKVVPAAPRVNTLRPFVRSRGS